MRANWSALHDSLQRSIKTRHAAQAFSAAAKRYAALRRFSDPGALVAFLLRPPRDFSAREKVIVALIKWAQTPTDSQIARDLLWLGLWPQLEATVRRSSRMWAGQHDALLSELAHCLLSEVSRIDTSEVHQVTATLLRNIHRDVRRVRQRQQRADENCGPLDQESEDEVPSAPEAERYLEVFRRSLCAVLGRDAEIIVGVFALGESHPEIANRLGLSHEVTRKRFQRAMSRLCVHFMAPPCPSSAPTVALHSRRRKAA